jgi:hypothetical protein
MTFDVPDAVAFQFTENLSAWSPWEPYATPKTINVSKGSGQKAVFVRFRDEAGNESVPGRIVVEAQSKTPTETPGSGIRSVAVGIRRKSGSDLELIAWIYGAGLKELSAELDGSALLGRGPIVHPWKTDILPAEGPRRLVLTAWDESGREHRAEAVFQDRDAPAVPRPGFELEEAEPAWRIGLFGGVAPLGVRFERTTLEGIREIEKGAMVVVRAEGTLTVADPLFMQLALDWCEGGDARIFSVGGDLGVRFPVGPLLGMELELGLQAGVYYSDLSVSFSRFGDFDGAVLMRAGVVLGVRLTESLWTEVMVDYRYARYEYDGAFGDGDKEANGSGLSIGAGLFWRF